MERELKTFLIPDGLCQRAGIAVSQGPHNQLSMYAYEKKRRGQADTPSAFAGNTPVSVHQIRQEIILFHPILRKLVNESNGVFVSLQQSSKSANFNRKSEVFEYSITYRSIIRACLENLQYEISRRKDNEELSNYVTIFYSIECIWHLCEILFISGLPANLVLQQLLQWIRFHFPKHDKNADELLANDQIGLESNPIYWDTVIGSLLQGCIEKVRKLLRRHSDSDTVSFKMANQLLETMPTFNMSSVSSTNEFNVLRKHWTVEVQAKIDSKIFNSEKNLNLLMRLLVGEEKAWYEVQTHCEAWYEFFAGWLFCTEPTVKPYELGANAKRCITMMGLANKLKHLDRVLLAVMKFDFLQVIIEVQNMSENGWFVTHLTDILYHSGLLESELRNVSVEKLRESFLLEYGMLMMGHKSLWQVGLTYLDYCQNDGIHIIEVLLPRVYPENEAKALKIIYEAKSRELNNIVHDVCKIQGIVSIKRKRLGNALRWAVKSQDGAFASFLADKFLEEFVKSGKLMHTDLLDNLGSCLTISDRLIFLGKYVEFHKFINQKKYLEAAVAIVSLLQSKIVPKYFEHILLMEICPLLEKDEVLLTSNHVCTIMHCFEDNEDTEQLKDKMEILKLAAVRHLTRALNYENQSEYSDEF